MPLIAYNINLNTDRLDVARKIAAAIRHSSGGLRYVKAMGVKLEDRNLAQVSINLTNYQKTPVHRVFDMVAREAARYGVTILESEVIGLIPSAALVGAAEHYLQLERFRPAQILENKLRERSSPRFAVRSSQPGSAAEHVKKGGPNISLVPPARTVGACSARSYGAIDPILGTARSHDRAGAQCRIRARDSPLGRPTELGGTLREPPARAKDSACVRPSRTSD